MFGKIFLTGLGLLVMIENCDSSSISDVVDRMGLHFKEGTSYPTFLTELKSCSTDMKSLLGNSRFIPEGNIILLQTLYGIMQDGQITEAVVTKIQEAKISGSETAESLLTALTEGATISGDNIYEVCEEMAKILTPPSSPKKSYETKLSEEEISDDDQLSDELLYASMKSAWVDLNDFSSKKMQKDFDSALYSVIAYISNKGNQCDPIFQRALGRVCYEGGEKLTTEQITNLGVHQDPTTVGKHGLELLKKLALDDEETADYLEFNGLMQ